jgi:ABC-type oligopeptide transport system substrate-binding subunit
VQKLVDRPITDSAATPRISGLFLDVDRTKALWNEVYRAPDTRLKRQAAIKILLDDAPIVPLYNPIDIYAVKRRLVWKPSAKDYINVAEADWTEK